MNAFTHQPITVIVNGRQVVIRPCNYRYNTDSWINLAVEADNAPAVSVCGGWLVVPGDASPYAPAEPCQDWQVVPYGGYDNCGGHFGSEERRLADALGYDQTDEEALLTMCADINAASRPILRAFREWARGNG